MNKYTVLVKLRDNMESSELIHVNAKNVESAYGEVIRICITRLNNSCMNQIQMALMNIETINNDKYDGLLDYVKCNGDSAAQAARDNSDIGFDARYPKARDRQNFLDGRSSAFAEILDYDSNFISKRLGETQ